MSFERISTFEFLTFVETVDFDQFLRSVDHKNKVTCHTIEVALLHVTRAAESRQKRPQAKLVITQLLPFAHYLTFLNQSCPFHICKNEKEKQIKILNIENRILSQIMQKQASVRYSKKIQVIF